MMIPLRHLFDLFLDPMRELLSPGRRGFER
jgi:hypothetical protein